MGSCAELLVCNRLLHCARLGPTRPQGGSSRIGDSGHYWSTPILVEPSSGSSGLVLHPVVPDARLHGMVGVMTGVG